MTLVHDAPTDGPATRALVVGVGDYPDVTADFGARWGICKRPAPGEAWSGAGLTSAWPSAMAFADWLIDEYVNDDAPLATVDMLGSRPGEPTSYRAVTVDPPTMANVRAAVRDWWQRCAKDDIAVLFFAGHGISKGLNDSLLTGSFGADPHDPGQDAVAFFPSLVEGFVSRCPARKHVFFLDACRLTPAELIEWPRPEFGQPVVTGTPLFDDADQVWVHATSRQRAAWSHPDGVSRFTRALLRALRGAACHDPMGTGAWTVRSESLVTGINDILAWERRRDPLLPHQVAKAGGNNAGFLFHRPREVVVPVLVGCEPRDDNARARLFIRHLSRDPMPDDWEQDLEVGPFEAAAELVDQQQIAGDRRRTRRGEIRPPWLEVRLP